MRIFIYHVYYPEFLEDFYLKNPEIKTLRYGTCQKALIAEQFGTGDFYSKNLKALGHETQDFIINDELLQKKWARENGVKYSDGYLQNIPRLKNIFRPDWMQKILLAQIRQFKPDIVYSHNLSALSSDCLNEIKKHTRLLVGQIAFQYPQGNLYKQFDLIVSSMGHFVEKFKQEGIQSEYLPFAFEPSILQTLKNKPDKYGAVFIGSFGKNHQAGTAILEGVADKVSIDFWGSGSKQIPPDSPIQKTYHGHAWGKDMYQVLGNSKICINRHIDHAGDHANNMRMYEATGVGTMLLTDMKSDLHKFFEIGKEIETYRDAAELTEKIGYYLDHESERAKIAKAGQERTLREYTYQKTMAQLANILTKYLK